ncbi:hydrogenase maturation protease [Methylomonas koyamae]|uniref:hydrogenase maturation protease n=1 Tax=Methylomonas koyamae TaxID=702114 RepID=UPI002872FC61|nr:hydrogenase maturation protease [Methylomonas koyamae]WNB75064.1 hydrogenase maturation protease [Methylomonas koyamae]
MAVAPILLLACGNPSRGDDALGPLLLDALADQIDPQTVECIVDFQLHIEHTLDLKDRQCVIFADASVCDVTFEFTRLTPAAALSHTSHALSPAALLGVYRSLHGEPPPAYLFGIGGLSFELGAALSPTAQTNLAAATRFARALLQGTPADIAASAAAAARMPD